MENPSYYAIIPASVRYDEKLSANAKLLFGEITALTSKEGYCWASNAYFATLYKATPRVVQMWMAQLRKQGHIKVVITGKGMSERKIFSRLTHEKNFVAPRKKMHKPHEKNFTQVLQENNTIKRGLKDQEENTEMKSIKQFIPTFIIEQRDGKARAISK